VPWHAPVNPSYVTAESRSIAVQAGLGKKQDCISRKKPKKQKNPKNKKNEQKGLDMWLK
jgi:hypothetical protein